jgi:hypothetical protein
LIGHVKDSPAFVQTSAIANVLSAMKRHHIKRILSLTGTGARMPNDTPSLVDRVLNTGIAIIDPERINDGIAHVDVLRESDADWTILRVLKLTDFTVHSYKLTEHGPARLLVSRAVVADALLTILAEDKFHKQAPIVS